MSRVETSIIINSPIEKVFDTIVDPEKGTQWSSGVSEIINIKGNHWEIGSSHDMVYHMVGIKLTNHMTTAEIGKTPQVGEKDVRRLSWHNGICS